MAGGFLDYLPQPPIPGLLNTHPSPPAAPYLSARSLLEYIEPPPAGQMPWHFQYPEFWRYPGDQAQAPPQDEVYRTPTPFLQRGREDLGIIATPRLPSENIDELIRAAPPEIFDARSLISRQDLENAQFNFAPGYLRKIGIIGR